MYALPLKRASQLSMIERLAKKTCTVRCTNTMDYLTRKETSAVSSAQIWTLGRRLQQHGARHQQKLNKRRQHRFLRRRRRNGPNLPQRQRHRSAAARGGKKIGYDNSG